MTVVNADLKYRYALTPLSLAHVKYIVVHHMAAINATPEDIHQWHLDRGWNGAGYSEYIRKDGTVYVMRGDNVGAHVEGYNSFSYGIGCEGNYDTEKDMPKAQRDALVERLKYHVQRFSQDVEIVPHSQLFNTSCPGKYFPLTQVLEEVYKKDVDAWKFEGINKLANMGLLNSPDGWKAKIDEPLPVWAGFLVLSRIAEQFLKQNEG